jgi:hypothetical protein
VRTKIKIPNKLSSPVEATLVSVQEEKNEPDPQSEALLFQARDSNTLSLAGT